MNVSPGLEPTPHQLRTVPAKWHITEPPLRPTLLLAVGYRMIDCAPAYENESVVGEGLKGFLQQVWYACLMD